MNAIAREALRILTQTDLTPSTDLERELFRDVRDYAKSPGKSNAIALLEKLRHEAEVFAGTIEDLERRDNAARPVFLIALANHLSRQREILEVQDFDRATQNYNFK